MNSNESIDTNKSKKTSSQNTLGICKVKFKDLDINDSFFDSLKKDYPEFLNWYKRKEEEDVYVYQEQQKILGLLFLKNEEPEYEDYSDIKPAMKRNRKLKISTFKVAVSGKKLGKQFMKIIFDQALFSKVDEIYLTLYNNDNKKDKLINYFEKYGFNYHGKKKNELVYVRKMNILSDRRN